MLQLFESIRVTSRYMDIVLWSPGDKTMTCTNPTWLWLIEGICRGNNSWWAHPGNPGTPSMCVLQPHVLCTFQISDCVSAHLKASTASFMASSVCRVRSLLLLITTSGSQPFSCSIRAVCCRTTCKLSGGYNRYKAHC